MTIRANAIEVALNGCAFSVSQKAKELVKLKSWNKFAVDGHKITL